MNVMITKKYHGVLKMLDKLYSNIGSKLKALAKGCFLVEAIGAISGGIYLMVEEDFLMGLGTVVGGIIVAWVSSWLLYGFGEVIDKLADIEQNTRPSGGPVIVQTVPEKQNAKGQLSVKELENAVAKYLGKSVAISKIACTLVYVIPASTGKPTEMHLSMTVGDKEFSSLDLMFFDKKRGGYYLNGERLALDESWLPVEQIFNFDVSMFKSFETETDSSEE